MIDTQESITAKICSFARAYHSSFEKDKIFDDYLAYDLMGKNEYDEIGSLIYNDFDVTKMDKYHYFKNSQVHRTLAKYIIPIPLSRIKFAEEKLQTFAKKSGDCQYVICGAGVDTFAFRNENKNIQIFEIDHPDTQRYKLQRIRDLEWNIPKNVHYVPVNFEKDNMQTQLLKAGFNINKKTFFSILGVTYYLELPVFKETLNNIADLSVAGNIVVFDYPDETTHNQGVTAKRVLQLAQITARLGEKMTKGFSYHSIKSALEGCGFGVEEYMSPINIQSKYFGNRTDNISAFENVHFISAQYKRGK
ncbi:MAG TPA: class I SAM-dependent methyltransferase [Clostridiales bacterium]|nr:class I SAM-dependent methyltransferase [Clostridiales bacterium]